MWGRAGGELEKVTSDYILKIYPEYVPFSKSYASFRYFALFCSQRHTLNIDKFFYYDLNKSNILPLVCIPIEMQGNRAV